MDLIFGKVIAIAFLVEVLTNFLKTLVPNLEKRYITIVAGIIGVLIATLSQVGIFSVLDISIQYEFADYFITGILISRGSNIVHDLAKALNLAS